MKNYVIVHAHDSNWAIPLVLKDRPIHLAGMLNFPGGKIEDGESPIEAAVRELKEETGLDPNSEPQLVGQIISQEYDPKTNQPQCIIYCISVQVLHKPINPQKQETEQVRWFDLSEAINDFRLMPNLRLVIPLIMEGKKDWIIADTTNDWKTKDRYEVTITTINSDYVYVRPVCLIGVGHGQSRNN